MMQRMEIGVFVGLQPFRVSEIDAADTTLSAGSGHTANNSIGRIVHW
ncbi:MAG: hypothetical protein PHQ60_07445 [Sideroxydans sp.]|nr:hypothetical protein [Sideroxydans sp.]